MSGENSLKFRKPLSIDGLYYSHGLVCASYPGTVVSLVAIVVILCSLPFFVTLTGEPNSPKPWRSPWLNYRTTTSAASGVGGEGPQWIIDNPSQFSGRIPSWFLGLPVAVVQQLYVNVEVNCSSMPELCLRSHYTTSKLAAADLITRLEHVNKLCHPVIHPAALDLTHSLTTPEPSSLPQQSHPAPHRHGILSPTLDSIRIQWGSARGERNRNKEGGGVGTNETIGHLSLKELLYGGFWEHEIHTSPPSRSSPLSQHHTHPVRGTSRHTFAVTFVLQASREKFNELTACVEAIRTVWPHPQAPRLSFMKHFFYEPDWSVMDFSPLLAVYCIVFLYISFSVGKIDLVKSKIGLGFTACITVIAALTMSLGICTFFGLSISLSGSEIYPYVVITIGLENILIIVKAVMSTPVELDVKYRIAVGLSKEGWAITRNLLTLAGFIVIGIATLNYAMKEFCIIALVGLMCDFFLQLVFFPTVLAIDLRRLELSDLGSTPIPLPDDVDRRSHSSQDDSCCPKSLRLATPTRWRSKRVKFAYFLARARIVSKGLMVFILVCLVAWFSKTETCHQLMTHLFQADVSSLSDVPSPLQLPLPPPATPPLHNDKLLKSLDPTISAVTVDNLTPPHMQILQGLNERSLPTSDINGVPVLSEKSKPVASEKGDPNAGDHWTDITSSLNSSEVRIFRLRRDGFFLKCDNGEACWRPMVTTHWPRLLRQFGFSVVGRFLTLLPPINLNFQVGFTSALPPSHPPSLAAHILAHPNTIRIAFLVVLATIVVSYSALLVQQSRWRHQRYVQSWKLRNPFNKMVCLKGHTQDVDCLCVDGGMVVSTSLDGDIRVWDANPMKRRCITVIKRSEYCGEPPPEVSSTIHRPAAEGCEADEEQTTPSAMTTTTTTTFPPPTQKGQSSSSRAGSVSDYPVQSSWEHMMQQSRYSHSAYPRPSNGVGSTSNVGVGEGKGVQDSSLRQRNGQMGGVSCGHVTSGGDHVTLSDVNQYQNSQLTSNGSRHSQSYVHGSHTPSPSSPPSSPLTSVPHKKHLDSNKPINIAVYSAPLSPHSEEKNPEHRQQHSPSSRKRQAFILPNFGAQQQSAEKNTAPLHYASHTHMPDHAPFAPRQPPNGYEQSATPPTLQPPYQLAPPPPNRPHPHPANDQAHKPLLRSGSASLTSSRSESQGHSSLRRSSTSGYGTQAPSSVSMVMHHYSHTSDSNQMSVVANSNQTPPTYNKQLSTKSLHGYPSSSHTCTHTDHDNSMMSSFSSPTLPSHTPHPPLPHGHNSHPPPPYGHTHPSASTFSTYSHASQLQNLPSQISTSLTVNGSQIATCSSVPLLQHPLVSRAELSASDVEAQPTPEMMLQRQPVAVNQSIPHSIPEDSHYVSGMGMCSNSDVSYSHSNSKYWSGSQTSLSTSHSSSKTRKTSCDSSKVPQIHVNPIPSTLVTSSTRTKPTAAINEGGSSSPLHRKRMGHCRHLSLGNNIPRQRPTHSRNRSLGSVNFNHILPPSTLSSRQESLGNLSLLSQASSKTGSRLSLASGFLSEAQVPQTPDPENGYDFVQHFNLFSQYTSNMALEYYTARRESSTHQPTTPPVWCMDVWNKIIVVGCGNGQVEAWHGETGSLIFSLNMTNSGVSSIAINSIGVVTGHMDGSLNLIGHNGILHFSVPAHSRPISILRCHGNKVITGGYDGVAMVHRLSDMVCVNSVFVHKGHVTAVTVVEPSGCVSGCSEGHVVHWDLVSGNCVHDLGEYGVRVVKLECAGGSTIGLLAENTVVVWENCSGETIYTLTMDGLCYDFAVLGDRHVAACFESHIVLYNLENGQKHSEKHLESERGVSFLRHILPLQDGVSVVCSSGKDVHIVPCHLKLKTD